MIQQQEIAIAAMTNSGRGNSWRYYSLLLLLEYALCPDSYKDVKIDKLALHLINNRKPDNPQIDPWVPLNKSKTETFKNMLPSMYSKHIPSLLLIVLYSFSYY